MCTKQTKTKHLWKVTSGVTAVPLYQVYTLNPPHISTVLCHVHSISPVCLFPVYSNPLITVLVLPVKPSNTPVFSPFHPFCLLALYTNVYIFTVKVTGRAGALPAIRVLNNALCTRFMSMLDRPGPVSLPSLQREVQSSYIKKV